MFTIDNEFLQETDLVCKVNTFFSIIRIYLCENFDSALISTLFDIDACQSFGKAGLFGLRPIGHIVLVVQLRPLDRIGEHEFFLALPNKGIDERMRAVGARRFHTDRL